MKCIKCLMACFFLCAIAVDCYSQESTVQLKIGLEEKGRNFTNRVLKKCDFFLEVDNQFIKIAIVSDSLMIIPSLNPKQRAIISERGELKIKAVFNNGKCYYLKLPNFDIRPNEDYVYLDFYKIPSKRSPIFGEYMIRNEFGSVMKHTLMIPCKKYQGEYDYESMDSLGKPDDLLSFGLLFGAKHRYQVDVGSFKKESEFYEFVITVRNLSFSKIRITSEEVIPELLDLNKKCVRGYVDFAHTTGSINLYEYGLYIDDGMDPTYDILKGRRKKKIVVRYTIPKGQDAFHCPFIFRVFDDKIKAGTKFSIKLNGDTVLMEKESRIRYFDEW